MKVLRLDFEYYIINLNDAVERLIPTGLNITTDNFFGLVDAAFIDAGYVDVKELDLYELLIGSVPTDPLVSMLSGIIQDIREFLFNSIPDHTYLILPDDVYYDGGTSYKLYWNDRE